MSSEEVSTERLTQNARPPPAVRSGVSSVAVVLPRHRFLQEARAVALGDRLVPVVRVDDGDARLVHPDMALDEGQGAPADRAEADHHDGAVNPAVHRPFSHDLVSPSLLAG